MVMREALKSQARLMQLIDTLNPSGLIADPNQSGKKQGRENGDDSDDAEQLDEGEG